MSQKKTIEAKKLDLEAKKLDLEAKKEKYRHKEKIAQTVADRDVKIAQEKVKLAQDNNSTNNTNLILKIKQNKKKKEIENKKKVNKLPTSINFSASTEQRIVKELGTILSVKDGVVRANGLTDVKAGEMVKFVGTEIFGMALNLEQSSVSIVIFGNDEKIKAGNSVERTKKLDVNPCWRLYFRSCC